MASMESEPPGRINEVIEAMMDSFAAYFLPKEFLNNISSIEVKDKQRILDEALHHPKDAMNSFLTWLIDQNVSGSSSQIQFYEALKLRGEEDFLPLAMLSPDGRMKWGSVTDMAKLFVDIVDGNKFENLTADTLRELLDVLTEQKVLKKREDIIVDMKPLEAIMKMIENVRRQKPEWPFIVYEIIKKRHPDIFRTEGSHLHENNPSASSSVSSCALRQQRPRKRKAEFRVTEEQFPAIKKLIGEGVISTSAVKICDDPENDRKGWNANNNSDYYSDGNSDDEETELKRVMEGVPDLNLRNYQRELAEDALDGRNVIINAPTGSGKTRVAMHIIINHLEQASEKNPKKVCFFARTVPLAKQQYKSIVKHLPEKYKAFQLTGDSTYSTTLGAFVPKNDVIVLTPMILQNHFDRGLLEDLNIFTLLVFDECHHTLKSEPYNTLMLSYLKMKHKTWKALPQVIGLTASFPAEKANSNTESINSVLQVCANLAADDISTVEVHEEELRRTVPVPQEDIEPLYELQEHPSVDCITTVMTKLEYEAQGFSSVIGDTEVSELLQIGKIPTNKKSQQYNQWTVKLKKAAENVKLTTRETLMPVRILMIIADYLKNYNIALEAYDLVHLKDVLSYLDASFKPFEENERQARREARFFTYYQDLRRKMENFLHEDNPNLSKLEEAIERHLVSKGEQSRGIIFVKTRGLAEALSNWLNRCGREAIMKLNATIFTGTNASELQGGMTQAEQDLCVEKFRKGLIRLLVATSVAEEGIDIPECNLVIKYNHVGNEISTIQTKGRSRKQGGRSILLAMPQIRDRELVNKHRADMMIEAVKEIRHMDATEKLSRIRVLQEKALKEQELDELMKKHARLSLQDKKFRMYCKMCRQVSIDSEHIKTIFGTHRVVTDWNIWKHVNVSPIQAMYIDDVKMIGSVRCRALVDKGTCNAPLGTLLLFKSFCFMALGIKNFMFVEEGQKKPQAFKQWKKVQYVVDEIDIQHIKRYIEDAQRSENDLQKKETSAVRHVPEAPVMNSREEVNEQSVHDNSSQDAVGGHETSYGTSGQHPDTDSCPPTIGQPDVAMATAKSGSEKSVDLSSFQSDDNHHQTDVVSMNTVTKNLEKHEMEQLLENVPFLSSGTM